MKDIKKSRSTALVVLAAVLVYATSAHANNIQVANSTLTGNTGTTIQVQFDLSWENSWRGGGVSNWDAAWVFVKYRTSATGSWLHANLNNTGHVAAAGSQVELGLLDPATAYDASTNPVVGVFISRDVDGSGNIALPNTQLNWAHGALGLAYNDIYEVRVFAVEMVYVNQGAFAAGTDGTEVNAFVRTTINTADATTAPSGTGSLGGQAGGYPTGQTAPANANWPNGYSAFYCMKYELTQQGYVDFLNTLTYTQQELRTVPAPNSTPGTEALEGSFERRMGIQIEISGVASSAPAVYACNLNNDAVFGDANDGKDLPNNFLSWSDLTAYLDWSGLRPMTELEFEKACRGTIAPVPNEYPWGTTGIASNDYTLTNVGLTNEGIATNYSTALGNANRNLTSGSIAGPVRVGIFSANGNNTGRMTAGASYYGIMELGGNAYERIINIDNSDGRAFTDVHGNGSLTSTGDSDAATWPTPVGNGNRGGSWQSPVEWLRVSDRSSAVGTSSGRGTGTIGGRGARSAP